MCAVSLLLLMSLMFAFALISSVVAMRVQNIYFISEICCSLLDSLLFLSTCEDRMIDDFVMTLVIICECLWRYVYICVSVFNYVTLRVR